MRAARENARGPVDPRLWRYSRAARGHLALTVATGVLVTGSVVVTALVLADILGGIITDPGRRSLTAWTPQLCAAAGAVLVRSVATWAQAHFGHRAALRVIADLKREVLTAGVGGDPRALAERRDALATVLTRGLDGLRPYLTGYLPALVLAATVTPATVVVVFTQDLTSALILVLTLPLVPAFMILVGLLTRGRARARLRTMTELSAQLLDLIAGLPTLRALGRERGPAARVRELGEAHRRSSMSALRVAFLSAMVLEMLATLCVALVAVSIGLRLVYGNMSLEAGLAALILAPEVYLPLRVVGAQFHAAEEGAESAGQAFAELACFTARSTDGSAVPPEGGLRVEFAGLSVDSRGGFAPEEFSAACEPGRVTVLTGPNGAGKSTALLALLGLVEPASGAVRVAGQDASELDLGAWWSRVAWLPQRPALLPGTDRATAAAEMSLGQRQQAALARVLDSDASVLLLDEPTAHLDPATEAAVLARVRAEARRGRTVIVVGHRPAVLAAADHLVPVGGATAADSEVCRVPA